MASERILVVDDEAPQREALRRLLEPVGYSVITAASAQEALVHVAKAPPSLIFTDLVMPGINGLEFIQQLLLDWGNIPVVVISARASIKDAVEAMKLGAIDVLEKPVDADALKLLLTRLVRFRETSAHAQNLTDELAAQGVFEELRGESLSMRKVYREIQRVEREKMTVLIVGESGTGKELVAETLHRRSPRAHQEFVAVNCAAIPATLLESEMFGHEKGAFTGAISRKVGCFEMAHKGTLFLDEIAEMDEMLQAKLLRVLQEQRFRRIGGREVIESDVRVVAATNRDPMEAIADGKLRADLYYRLAVFKITLPPLREHPEDIQMLAQHFAERYAERNKTTAPAIHETTLELLQWHSWPGNVRELKNVIERASLLSGGRTILPRHLPEEIIAARARASAATRDAGPTVPAGQLPTHSGPPRVTLEVGSSMEEAERKLITSTLEATAGNKTRAAKLLGISLKTMHNKVKKYRL
jgi:DNA-binding NtrC family response regulator